MKRSLPIRAFVLGLVLVMTSLGAQAASSQLDTDARAALNALYESSPAAKALGAQAKAILVFPDVKKAALILGGQGGDGVMFQNGRVAGHYSLGGLQIGFEAGAQAFAYAMFFMSDRALADLRADRGFEIGADPNIVFVDAGAAAQVTTTTVQADVYTYVFDQKGLMAGLSLQGTKITRQN